MRRTVPVLLGCLICAGAAYPWGEDGHRITGVIADAFLTDAARDAVQDLLGDASLAEVSTWADEVRPSPYWSSTAPLHYVNVKRGEDSMAVLRDCRSGESILGALAYYRMVLESSAADPQSRKEALKFLVHFIGDIHQPLHVSYREDKGGNDVDVRFFGSRANLHRVWDSLMLKRHNDDWRTFAATLRAEITDASRAEWGSQDPVRWAQESYGYVRTTAYAYDDPFDLGTNYQNRNLPVVMLRLKQAGVRIAAVLNDVFAPAN